MAQQEPESKPTLALEVAEEAKPTVMARPATMIPEDSWFTPKRLLVIFCVISLITYLDRGAIASNGVNGSLGTCSKNGTCTHGTGIQGDFNLSNFEDGILSSAFMVGLLVASPIFASLAKSVIPFRLIGVGLLVWTVAIVGCGVSQNFWSIVICRMFVGIGEASFISLAAPFIDDNAPPAKKTAWLAIFYMCIPAGYALGYIVGGLIGDHFGWRIAFFVEAVLMVPFVVLGFCVNPLQLKGFVPAESKSALAAETNVSPVQEDVEDSNGNDDTLSFKAEFRDKGSHEPSMSKSSTKILDEISMFFKDMKVLLLDKVYVVNVLGYIAYNFVIGAYSYWGPKAGKSIYNMEDADIIFGGITVLCGIVGALAGGFILDSLTNTISNAFKVLSTATFIGAAFCFGAFCFRNMYGFLALFAIGELFIFATQGPVNFVCLHCVKPSLRPLSMAMSTVAIHIFGDVPSSPLVGVLQDRINNWRRTALILTTIFFPAAVLWFIGIFLPSVDRFNEDSVDRFNEDCEHQASAVVEKSNTTPLLQERPGGTAYASE
ncbi:hypothetical protein L6164_036439 [Bauhinia variegata]|uniref:Uncharacterized protein n=1 Tax=Bauhinia variegata TaxID=167791 RepID=A0ACB9KH76_BAUVA|nr:hypothetical protein L6164_036439 [Bauhinia variegata]